MIYFIAWISPSPLEVPLQKSEFVEATLRGSQGLAPQGEVNQ